MNITYYLQDSTIGKYIHFKNVSELVTYLEGVVERAHKMTRKQYMQNLIELGYGYDDDQGVTFTRSMADEFNIGVIKNGKYIKTDVHAVQNFSNPAFGH